MLTTTRQWSAVLGIAMMAAAACTGLARADADDAAGVRGASDRFYAALNAMFTGDLGPMKEVWSHSGDATDLNPFGGRQVGWDDIMGQFEKERALKLGGRVAAKDVLVRVTGDMGYTVCVEEGEHMTAAGKPLTVKHRATNIFRRENGQWKLIHHHTDLSPSLLEAEQHAP